MKYYIFKEILIIFGLKILDRVYFFYSYLFKIIKCIFSKGDFLYLFIYVYIFIVYFINKSILKI